MNETKNESQDTKRDNVAGFFSAIDRPQYKPVSYSESLNGKGYVNWGAKNDFPEYLWSIYMRCSTLQSILNGYVDYTIGDEIKNNTVFQGENAVGDTMHDVVCKVILDLWVYGGFAVQVFYNEIGEVLNIAYLDIARIRTNQSFTKYYVIDDFKHYTTGTKRAATLEFDAFGTLTQEERAEKGSEIFYYKGKKTKGYYPVCDYISAIISAETQIEIKRFHFNNISNGMLSATILNFNDAENVSEEMKDKIEAGIKRKFSGPSGAGEIMISWNSDKDHEVNPAKLDDDNFDSKFTQLAEDTRDDLFISLRASQQLFGFTVNTTFNTQEFNEVFALVNKTIIAPKQNEIVRSFNKIFDMGTYGNDIDSLEIIPFTLTSTNIDDGEALDS